MSHNIKKVIAGKINKSPFIKDEAGYTSHKKIGGGYVTTVGKDKKSQAAFSKAHAESKAKYQSEKESRASDSYSKWRESLSSKNK